MLPCCAYRYANAARCPIPPPHSIEIPPLDLPASLTIRACPIPTPPPDLAGEPYDSACRTAISHGTGSPAPAVAPPDAVLAVLPPHVLLPELPDLFALMAAEEQQQQQQGCADSRDASMLPPLGYGQPVWEELREAWLDVLLAVLDGTPPFGQPPPPSPPQLRSTAAGGGGEQQEQQQQQQLGLSPRAAASATATWRLHLQPLLSDLGQLLPPPAHAHVQHHAHAREQRRYPGQQRQQRQVQQQVQHEGGNEEQQRRLDVAYRLLGFLESLGDKPQLLSYVACMAADWAQQQQREQQQQHSLALSLPPPCTPSSPATPARAVGKGKEVAGEVSGLGPSTPVLAAAPPAAAAATAPPAAAAATAAAAAVTRVTEGCPGGNASGPRVARCQLARSFSEAATALCGALPPGPALVPLPPVPLSPPPNAGVALLPPATPLHPTRRARGPACSAAAAAAAVGGRGGACGVGGGCNTAAPAGGGVAPDGVGGPGSGSAAALPPGLHAGEVAGPSHQQQQQQPVLWEMAGMAAPWDMGNTPGGYQLPLPGPVFGGAVGVAEPWDVGLEVGSTLGSSYQLPLPAPPPPPKRGRPPPPPKEALAETARACGWDAWGEGMQAAWEGGGAEPWGRVGGDAGRGRGGGGAAAMEVPGGGGSDGGGCAALDALLKAPWW